MTTYFDAKDAELRVISRTLFADGEPGSDWGVAMAALDHLDVSVVWDVSICAGMPGFPADLRTAVHEMILRYSPAGQPRTGSTLDFGTTEEHIQTVSSLIHGLHTIFHEVGARHLDDFGDDPKQPLYELYGQGEEIREDLAKGAAAGKKDLE